MKTGIGFTLAKRFGLGLLIISIISHSLAAAVTETDAGSIAPAVNAVGVEIYHSTTTPSGGNMVMSPYSIQTALAMAYAGADGDTKAEMGRVLHLSGQDETIAEGFAAFQQRLTVMTEESRKQVGRAKSYGGPSTPVEVTVASRLFMQAAYPLRKPFISLLSDRYRSPLEQLDFRNAADKARTTINHWVEEQTRRKIRNFIPPDGVTRDTKVVLVNAIYLNAPWQDEFYDKATRPERFHASGNESADVPMMVQTTTCGYAKRDGYTAIQLPYAGGELSFLVLLPEANDGLPAFEKRMSAELLMEMAKIPRREVELHLPKFKIEPPTVPLGDVLQTLGMKTAFDKPQGSANFDRMAERKPDDYLYISAVFHKAFLALDEQGTEAAAATAISIPAPAAAIQEKVEPPVVRVDHPFVFAIQHLKSGTCLFLGRVVDPR